MFYFAKPGSRTENIMYCETFPPDTLLTDQNKLIGKGDYSFLQFVLPIAQYWENFFKTLNTVLSTNTQLGTTVNIAHKMYNSSITLAKGVTQQDHLSLLTEWPKTLTRGDITICRIFHWSIFFFFFFFFFLPKIPIQNENSTLYAM